MGRLNTAVLLGVVKSEPSISGKEEMGQYVETMAAFPLTVLRRSFADENWFLHGAGKWDDITVITKHPPVIKQVRDEIGDGDIVLIKGTIVTQDTRRKFICKNCSHVQYKEMAVSVYVDPISITVLKHGLHWKQFATEWAEERKTDFAHVKSNPTLWNAMKADLATPLTEDRNASWKYIQTNVEVSNQVHVVGTVCKEPDPLYRDPDTGFLVFSFTIATDRLRYILEDDPDKKADYPVVKCFGPNCEIYAYALHVGSEVLIDGALQGRKHVQTVLCEECGNSIEREINTIEIVPYHVEFLKNCTSPKEMLEGETDNVEDTV